MTARALYVVMDNVERLRKVFDALAPVMDERTTRLWAAAEAQALGRGGVTEVTAATGILHKRIVAGKRELEQMRQAPLQQAPREQRIRRKGAGRKRLEVTDPDLLSALDVLIEPAMRGDPQSPLRWTCKSTHKLAAELTAQGHPVSASKVCMLLGQQGYSLQSNRKTREGAQHPERNAQFEFINRQTKSFQALGLPVISVDTKKKEILGDFKNAGREWSPKGSPTAVRVHDFLDPELGKAIPYGVYDVARNEGWVSVGVDHDTAEFAVETIRRWWMRMGKRAYPQASEVMITADGGGSNGARVRLWKAELQRFADLTGLTVHVTHYPPGTSKWNKIEHRMFSHITQNWRGRPLESLQTVVNLIGATTTKQGLRIRAAADLKSYDAGIEVGSDEIDAIAIQPHQTRGYWNYKISPRL